MKVKLTAVLLASATAMTGGSAAAEDGFSWEGELEIGVD